LAPPHCLLSICTMWCGEGYNWCLWIDSFVCDMWLMNVPWLIRMWHVTHECDITHSYVTCDSCMCHDSLPCAHHDPKPCLLWLLSGRTVPKPCLPWLLSVRLTLHPYCCPVGTGGVRYERGGQTKIMYINTYAHSGGGGGGGGNFLKYVRSPH